MPQSKVQIHLHDYVTSKPYNRENLPDALPSRGPSKADFLMALTRDGFGDDQPATLLNQTTLANVPDNRTLGHLRGTDAGKVQFRPDGKEGSS